MQDNTTEHLHSIKMSSSDIYYIEILKNIYIYLHQYILPIFYILGNAGNLLSISIFTKKAWRKNVCVFYFNICLLFNTCYINSAMLGSIFLNGFSINLLNSNVVLCKIYYYISFLFSILLPTILILASIDRLLISSQNVDTRLYSSKRLAYFSVGINIFFWVVFLCHILIKVNLQAISPSSFTCYYDLSELYIHFVSFSAVIINCLFCFTMIVLSIFAFKNVRRIRSIPRQQRKQIRTMTKKDFQLLRCLYVQVIVYIIFNIGLSITITYKAAPIYQMNTQLTQTVVDFIHNFCSSMHHIPYCASFYIFMVVSKAFRHELKRMIYKVCGKNLAPVREEENKQENIEKDNVELDVAIVDRAVSVN